MGVTLITGPAKCGKTTAAVRRLAGFSPLELATSVRYVVPTRTAARQVESQLMAQMGVSGLLGNVVCTFFSFAGDFIAHEGLASHLISDVKKELTLRKLVREANGPYLARSAESPGFIRALDQIIGELKTALVDPAEFKAAWAAARPSLSSASNRKLGELADLYQRYQDDILLAHDLHDREGLMWRALDIARAGEQLADRKIVVFDGFDRMNAVERGFVAAVAKYVPEVVVNLTYEPDRHEVFEPTEVTREFVLSLGAVEERMEAGEPVTSPDQLANGIFRSGAPSTPTSDGLVKIIEGCDPAMEVQLVAEEILRLACTGEYDWNDFVVTTRDGRAYTDRVAETFAQFDIPLVEPKRPLAETAMARLLVASLNIIRDDWPRDEVITFLKSELISEDPVVACRVEIEAKKRAIVGGRQQWLDPWGEGDKYVKYRRAVLRPVIDFASSVRQAKSLSAMAQAARGLVETFKWRIHDDRALAEDAAAQRAIMEVLTEIEEAVGLLGPGDSFDFFNRLEEIIYITDYEPAFAGDDAVSLVSVTAMAGQSPKVVFVLGLLEKIFPRSAREEPFLRDRERRALNEHVDGRLEIRLGPAPGEDRFLFYRTVGATAERLYLCYPLADEAAQDSLPSFYLDEVRKVLGELPRIRRDHTELVAAPEKVFGVHPLKQSVTYGLARSVAKSAETAARAYNQLLVREPGLFASVFYDSATRGASLQDVRILESLRTRERAFRCTELEAYAACPFRHFCSYTLRLKGIREEIDALDFGSLIHDVLYRLFTDLRVELGPQFKVGTLDREATGGRARDILDTHFAEQARLLNMPDYEREVLLHDLQTTLTRYMKCEIENARPGFTPTFFELEFGSPAVEGRARDEHSTEKPLVIEGPNGPVAVCGKIDRVDVLADGAVVIDYKTGQAPNLANYANGQAFQPIIYAAAVKQLFELEPVGAEYRPVKQWGPDGYYLESSGITTSRQKRMLDEVGLADVLEAGEQLAAELAERIRAGSIVIEPHDCPEYCEFAGVCRWDGERDEV